MLATLPSQMNNTSNEPPILTTTNSETIIRVITRNLPTPVPSQDKDVEEKTGSKEAERKSDVQKKDDEVLSLKSDDDNLSRSSVPKIKELFKIDPFLKPFRKEIERRYECFTKLLNDIEEREEGGLNGFSQSYKKFGTHVKADGSVYCREWCPAAEAVYLWGDFNNWQRVEYPFTRLDFGQWELTIPPNEDGTCRIMHGSTIKLIVVNRDEHFHRDRLSPWAHFVVRTVHSPILQQILWNPKKPYVFRHGRPSKPSRLRIYECHVGISSDIPIIAGYNHFRKNVLPRIVELGYNAIQLMATMEHAYYASFGYQVTSFFAPSSRYGIPEELKELIDSAHQAGVVVILDVIHSHASPNVVDGLNQFDGTMGCYFHEGERGIHSRWGSRLFNYSNWEVLRFLLSNLRWWMDEYRFDGFRFDGVTSMLYYGKGNLGSDYAELFGSGVDTEAVTYLTIANHVLHTFYPYVITIAEEVSGMPGMARPVKEGGIGFDYNLAMAVSDKWIELIHDVPDEQWDVGNIVWTLTNRRPGEKYIAYTECHDQSLVGDKTLIFRMLEQEMYDRMSVLSPPSVVVDRGIALHKMMRLITHSLGGESYLNFMGNEFGHPEWLDFPRDGNYESCFYARRQWKLVDSWELKYQFLNNFDIDMNKLEAKYGWLAAERGWVSRQNIADKVIVFERAGLLFVFNFHPTNSFTDYKIGTESAGTYRLVLHTDDKRYHGFGRIDTAVKYIAYPDPWDARPSHMFVYIPHRTALVFALEKQEETAEAAASK